MRKAGLVLAVVALGLALVALSPFGQGVRDLWARGIPQSLVAKPPERRSDPDIAARLRRIRTALELYHDSEDHYPSAEGWNDAVRKRLKAADLAPGEAEKILDRPGGLTITLNDAAASKYRKDLAPSTVLVYESDRPGPNAHGSPSGKGPKGRGITVDGTLVEVPVSPPPARPAR